MLALDRQADFKLDFRGAITSFGLLKLSRVFREMKSNQTLEILGVDADARSDLFRVLPKVSYELLEIEERDGALTRIQIKKN
jgi:TusA-related sulfurtransferase